MARPTARRIPGRRPASLAVAALVALFLMSAPPPALAQAARVDSRWRAWVGCWTASQNQTPRAVCVVPAPGASAVDVMTIGGAGAAARERIQADGERHPSERDGCTGWETAKWSADARRIYLQSEHECASGAKRTSQALMTMSQLGEWLDVVSVSMGGNTGVRVLRHQPITAPPTLPADTAAAIQTARSSDARTAAAAPIGLTDIIDASHELNATVVAAWLNDIRQEIPIDAKRLVQLADAGVPGRVVDMLVALAYPDAFSVPPSPTSAGSLASSTPNPGGRGEFEDVGSVGSFGCASDFSVFGWDTCAPFAYAPFGIFSAAYLPFALSPYGYRTGLYPYAYGGWYTGDPGVIVIHPDTTPHGQVVKGHGYTNTANPGGSTATTSTTGNTSSSGGSASTASAPASSGGAGSGAASGSSSSSGASSGGDRTAHPR